MNPFLLTDAYKTGHHLMYPENTTLVYSNFTPRSGKHAPKGINEVTVFGTQLMVRYIKELFDDKFFCTWQKEENELHEVEPGDAAMWNNMLKERVCGEIKREYSMFLGTDFDVSHIEGLWDLGYLPVRIKSLPEGTQCPFGVPVMTICNTIAEFYWVTNFLETLISNVLWKPMTSATIARQYRQILDKYAAKTDTQNPEFVNFQGHDFSMRGMDSPDAAVASGLGHATSFMGSDTLPVIHGARKYYDEEGFVIGSVPATEHAVMCAGTKEDEIETFQRLMKTFPTGILSVVSDTWDLWKVITEYLPQLKDEIMARDGKLVIRPDSGNPVDIICGMPKEQWTRDIKDIPKQKGVIELLWEIFGGTINDNGYKILDPHIGAIYGDSITLDRAEQICERLKAKGFASTNIVLGIGSFTYQYNTRDTFGFAMKATYTEVEEEIFDTAEGGFPDFVIKGIEIFKDPVTDDGTKKSAKGLLTVRKARTPEKGVHYMLVDQVDWDEEGNGELQTIFEDGELKNQTTLTEIRERIKNGN